MKTLPLFRRAAPRETDALCRLMRLARAARLSTAYWDVDLERAPLQRRASPVATAADIEFTEACHG